jgi:hypothetical protein
MAENRVLAPPPAVRSIKEFRNFPKMAEAYVNDRFGLRSELVHLNSLWRYRMGISSTPSVVIGSDGWLFYTADKLMEQHTGSDIFSPPELENWVHWMEVTRDWLAQRNIGFYVLIAPDKDVIYPEKLPLFPRRANGTTRLDQLAERLTRSTIEYIDPTAALIKAKLAGVPVYIEADSHWTEQGAFVAYSMLMEHIRKRYPNVEPLHSDDYTVTQGRPIATDLLRLLALEDDFRYTVERLILKRQRPTLGPPVISMRPGWAWRVVETKTQLPDKPRVLVFGDSFTDYVLGPGMLYETFHQPVWTFHFGGMFNFNFVREFQPDLVIFQTASRYLRLTPSKPLGID